MSAKIKTKPQERIVSCRECGAPVPVRNSKAAAFIVLTGIMPRCDDCIGRGG